MWKEGGGCGGRVVDVKEGWMWRKGGCGERIDVEGGCGGKGGGCEGRMVDVEGGRWR